MPNAVEKKNTHVVTPVLSIVLGAIVAQAHVAVLPRESAVGATQKLRVHDEKNIPTVRTERAPSSRRRPR